MFVSVRGSNNSRDILVLTENQKGKWKNLCSRRSSYFVPFGFHRKVCLHSSSKIPTNILLQLIGKSIQRYTWDSLIQPDVYWPLFRNLFFKRYKFCSLLKWFARNKRLKNIYSQQHPFHRCVNTCQRSTGRQHEQPCKEQLIELQFLGVEPILSKVP